MSPHIPYTPPYLNGKSFNCPHCHAYAKQEWSDHWDNENGQVAGLKTSFCTNCKQYAIWLYGNLLHPATTPVEPPSDDLPLDAKTDYEEAALIVGNSPRAAAALLRLAIDKVCTHLGAHGDLDTKIGELVKRGLPTQVRDMLDIVRVVGNHSVHAGVIDLNDSPQAALALFGLINKVVDEMITKPKELENLRAILPERDLKQIEKRDKIES